MLRKKPNNPVFFYILALYIILQFVWWNILLIKQTGEIFDEKQKLTELASTNEDKLKEAIKEQQRQKTYRIYMIEGEAVVFLILISVGMVYVYKTHKRERELNTQQRNFLLSITHELKSPIASIKLQMQTLMKRDLVREMQQKLLSNALQDTERLNVLVENVLLSARLDVKNDFLQREHLNISQLVEEVIQKNIQADLKERIKSNIQPGIFMKADKLAFPSIIVNLLENAGKYAADASVIDLSLQQVNKEILLSIADQGPGIPDVEKARVFKKFYRMGNEETRNAKGTGLGLFIVKRLTEQHGGKITIQNNMPKGTLFKISFPVTTA